MARLVDDLVAAVSRHLPETGLGNLYTANELLALVGDSAVTAEDVVKAVGTGDVTIRYRGGWTGVAITLDKPNRASTLRRVGDDLFSLDTEAAIQAGAQIWLESQGLSAREEVPDQEPVWTELARSGDLSSLAWDVRRAGTACRDIVALRTSSSRTRVEIWEAKGKTAVEGDFYEAFGQIFPINDSAVTKGWTNNSVPKHGRGLGWAEFLENSWADRGSMVSLAVGVLVPDLPPPGSDPNRFYDGPSCYYGSQASLFRNFAQSGQCHGEQAFPRLLRHLRDKFDLLNRMRGKATIGFRFLGYQGVGFVRDFATGLPVDLASDSKSTAS